MCPAAVRRPSLLLAQFLVLEQYAQVKLTANYEIIKKYSGAQSQELST